MKEIITIVWGLQYSGYYGPFPSLVGNGRITNKVVVKLYKKKDNNWIQAPSPLHFFIAI